MECNLGVLRSDGVEPAVGTEALNVLQAVGEGFGHSFNLDESVVGGVAADTLGRTFS